MYFILDKMFPVVLILSFLLINIIVNSIIICSLNLKNKCFYNENLLQRDYLFRRSWLSNSDSGLEKIILRCVYWIYLRIDIIIDLLKLFYETDDKSKKNYNNKIDLIIIIYFISSLAIYFTNNIFIQRVELILCGFSIWLILIILFIKLREIPSLIVGFLILIFSVVIYFNISISDEIFQLLLCGFFTWQILTIIIIKLNEILSFQFKEAKFRSFNRTILFFIINFVQIVIGYSFLYSSYYFSIFAEGNFGTIFKTMKIFTEWSLEGIGNYRLAQQLLVLSQVFVFIIFIMVFLANVQNFDFKRKK